MGRSRRPVTTRIRIVFWICKGIGDTIQRIELRGWKFGKKPIPIKGFENMIQRFIIYREKSPSRNRTDSHCIWICKGIGDTIQRLVLRRCKFGNPSQSRVMRTWFRDSEYMGRSRRPVTTRIRIVFGFVRVLATWFRDSNYVGVSSETHSNQGSWEHDSEIRNIWGEVAVP